MCGREEGVGDLTTQAISAIVQIGNAHHSPPVWPVSTLSMQGVLFGNASGECTLLTHYEQISL